MTLEYHINSKFNLVCKWQNMICKICNDLHVASRGILYWQSKSANCAKGVNSVKVLAVPMFSSLTRHVESGLFSTLYINSTLAFTAELNRVIVGCIEYLLISMHDLFKLSLFVHIVI